MLLASWRILGNSHEAGRRRPWLSITPQKLSRELLEEIELLGKLENRDNRLFQVVFAAQPGFEAT